jgi:serine/threonine protein phosphatase PrpC
MDTTDKALFGVFDGHGGREVAIFCKNKYEKILCDKKGEIPTLGEKEWLRESFLRVDDEIRTEKG